MPDSLFTLIAQIVNFLIIVVVLRILLFKRVTGAIDERKNLLKKKHEKAESETKELHRKREDLEKEHENFRKEKDNLMEKARRESHEKGEALLEQAKKDVNEKRKQWEEQFDKERSAFVSGLKKSAVSELILIARRAINDLTGEDAERLMVRKLVRALENSEEEDSVNDKFSPKRVVSSFSMDEDLRKEFSPFGEGIDFEDTDEFHGVALESDGKRIEWTIESWLDEFEQGVYKRLEQ